MHSNAGGGMKESVYKLLGIFGRMIYNVHKAMSSVRRKNIKCSACTMYLIF